LADDPYRAGSRAHPEFGYIVRSIHLDWVAGRRGAARHELFYAVHPIGAGNEELVILRVLHDAMDPAGRVKAALRRDLRRS
jgi:toxin ParE1/3/4